MRDRVKDHPLGGLLALLLLSAIERAVADDVRIDVLSNAPISSPVAMHWWR